MYQEMLKEKLAKISEKTMSADDLHAIFGELTEIGLQDPDILKRSEKGAVNRDSLRPLVREREEQILSTVSEERKLLNKYVIQEYDTRLAVIMEVSSGYRFWIRLLDRILAISLWITGTSVLSALIMWIGWMSFGATTQFFMSKWYLFYPIIISPILSPIVAITNSKLVRKRGYPGCSSFFQPETYINYEKALDEHGIQNIRDSILEVRKKIHETILESGILPTLNEIIELQSKPSFDLKVMPLEGTGLSEVYDANNDISTGAMDKLDFMLRKMSGGSIGIAGPRGAGKTTLMRKVCNYDRLENHPVISILTSAPIQYDVRDFILHLFASVCSRAWSIFEQRPETDLEFGVTPFADHPRSIAQILRTMRPLILFLFIAGALLFSVEVLTFNKNNNEAIKSTIDDRSTLLGDSTIIDSTVIEGIDQSPNSLEQGEKSFLYRLSEQYLEIFSNPNWTIKWGLGSMILAFLLLYTSIVFSRKDRLRKMMTEDKTDIGRHAREWLQRIRFQQSYTGGWSGSLKIPAGFEGGVNNAIELSRHQLSLPEIVDGYGRFLKEIIETVTKQAPKGYVILVGIDEMDKMQSDDKARKFLNDIKAMFGQRGCFYLLSVSVSALSSFERRGIKLRDAFDSTFDNILRVDYLNLIDSRRLLARRLPGLPYPFVCLCHTLSEGVSQRPGAVCQKYAGVYGEARKEIFHIRRLSSPRDRRY